MQSGFEFPPVQVWFDGTSYWLTDGFHRMAAAEQAGFQAVNATVSFGTQRDALWDSYAANSRHGLRRTREELKDVVRSALQHDNSAILSNVEIARHLGIPEATLRRWRNSLSSTSRKERVRTVTRKGRIYEIDVSNIGVRSGGAPALKSRRDLSEGITTMKTNASPAARRAVNIIANWALGTSTALDCLRAIENLLTHGSQPGETRMEPLGV